MPGDVAPPSQPAPSDLPHLARYDVVRRLGEGGMGIVFEAIERERGTRVALKMLRRLDADTLLRLKEEFRALQDLEHPNLIRLGELTCDEGTWFFTMELVDGEHFQAWLRHHGGDPSATRKAFAQLARGLVALHAAGKVHRDVKPSNVLVAKDGRVVLVDFGLVRDATRAAPDEDDMLVGTISHMAPEQALGEEVGPPSDWYAVGAILYEHLAGRAPYDGSATEIVSQKIARDPPPPHTIASDVPADLDALCMELLSRDPARRPAGAEVLRRIEARRGSDQPKRTTTMAAGAPFVGRVKETEALRDAFASARAGRATTVIVEGESGVGKSALVRHFTRELAEAGDALVLAGRCYEREDVPYKAIDGVIDALSRELVARDASTAARVLPPTAFVLAHAFPVLRRVPGVEVAPSLRLTAQESRTMLFGALRDLFANLAHDKPLVIAIDDLQWADADGLALLAEVLRPPAPPILLVATARASDRRPGSSPFGLPGEVRVVPVPPLAPEEGLALVSMLAGSISSSVAARIAAEAGGHPLFVDELVRHAQMLGGRALPAHSVQLDEALVARVDRLDGDARSLLELMAVAGVALPQAIVMRAAAMAFDDFAKHVQTLRAAHLARTHGWRDDDAIEPYHDRVREAVSAHLAPEAKRAYHEALARALESAESRDADALSAHWLGAGDAAKAGAYARKAADQARAAFAFERAGRLYERALTHAALSDDEKQQLRIALGETLTNAGHGAEAARAFEDAAAHATSADATLELRRRVAEELLTAGRFDEGEAALREVLRAVGLSLPRTPIGTLVGLLLLRLVVVLRGVAFRERAATDVPPQAITRVDSCASVGTIFATVDTIRGAYFQTRTLLYALGVGEPNRVAHALAIEAVYSATSGDSSRSTALLDRAASIVERTQNVRVSAMVTTAIGWSHFVLGRFPPALVSNDRGAATLREHDPGAFWHIRTALSGANWSLAWMGDLAELARRSDQQVREAERRGDRYFATSMRTGLLNLVWLRNGDVGAARTIAVEATRQWTQRGYHSQHYWSLLALSHVELYEGRGADAYARVTREWSRVARSLILQVRVMGIEAHNLRGRAAIAAASEGPSDRARLLRAAGRDVRSLLARDWTPASAFGHALRAGIASVRRDHDAAASALDLAARAFDDAAMKLHAASSRWQLGKLRGGDEGRALVVAAESFMRAQGIADPARMAGLFVPGF